MVIFSIVLFAVSITLLIALFAVKLFELRRGIVLAPELRDRADDNALQLKRMAFEAEKNFTRLPSLLWLLVRFGIHVFALSAARLARLLEEKAHQLADFVSQKRGFERREARSEFLKKVSEVKNWNGKPSTNVR